MNTDLSICIHLEPHLFICDTFGFQHTLSTLNMTESDTHSHFKLCHLYEYYKQWAVANGTGAKLTQQVLLQELRDFFKTQIAYLYGDSSDNFEIYRNPTGVSVRLKHKYVQSYRSVIYSMHGTIKERLVWLEQQRFVKKLSIEEILQCNEVKNDLFLRCICNRAKVRKQQKERTQYLKQYNLSNFDTTSLLIPKGMDYNKKFITAGRWKMAFESDNPPDVLEIHQEYTDIMGSTPIVDVTLRLYDSRVIRVEELPLSFLPSNKRQKH